MGPAILILSTDTEWSHYVFFFLSNGPRAPIKDKRYIVHGHYESSFIRSLMRSDKRRAKATNVNVGFGAPAVT